jgi:hypothetical protein
VWGTATFAFSLAQGIGGFIMASAAAHMDSYKPLMVVSALALAGSIWCLLRTRQEPPAATEPQQSGPVPAPEPDIASGAPASSDMSEEAAPRQ